MWEDLIFPSRENIMPHVSEEQKGSQHGCSVVRQVNARGLSGMRL